MGYPYVTAKHESRQPMFFAVAGTLLLLSTITVSLRLYSRIFYIHHVGLDDYFMVAALCVAIGMGVMNAIHVGWGTGQHTLDLPLLEILQPTLKHWYAYQLVYPFALFFVKISILSLYHRIFPEKSFRKAVYIVMGVVSLYTIVVVFVNAFECWPPDHAWAPTFPKGCNNLSAAYFSMASINILTDIVILILPLRSFSKLNLHRRKRWALIGIFLTGSVAVVASIVRLNALYIYTVTKDVAWDAIYILLWSQIEVNFAIISASAPSLRPLFKGTFDSTNSYGRSRGYSGNRSANMFSRRPRSGAHGAMELHSYSGPERTLRTTVTGKGDGDSEEHILVDKPGITRTVETRVNYENGDAESKRSQV